MTLDDERYILVSTFRRDGTPVATPVSVVKLDDATIGFWTSSGSGKAKRLAHTARVTVAPCDARGRCQAGHGRRGRDRTLGGRGASFRYVTKHRAGWFTAQVVVTNTGPGDVVGGRRSVHIAPIHTASTGKR